MPYGRCGLHVCARRLLRLLAFAIFSAQAPAALAEAADDAEEIAGSAELEMFRTGIDSEPAFEDAVELARFQRGNGEYVDALRTLGDLLDQVRDEHGQWDMRNVVVLSELAAVQRALGNLDQSAGLYQEAIHVNRVNQGLHDITQIDILDDLTEVQVQLRDFEAANQLQEYAFYVQQREYGRGSAEILPGLYRLANWWQRTGQIFSARALYEQAIRTIETNYGPDDVRLVDALRGLANTYRAERYPSRPLLRPEQQEEDFQFTSAPGPAPTGGPFAEDTRVRLNRYGEGEEALVRIVDLVDAHPGSTLRERAQSRLDLGDWFLVFDKWNSAFETYGEVRTLLEEDGWDEARIETVFGEPTALVFPLPDPPNRPDYGDIEAFEGYVDLVYDITPRGRVRRVDVVGSLPDGLMDFRTRKAVKAARFRPRFVGGEPQETLAVEFRHEFVYFRRREDVEADARAAAEAAAAEQAGAAAES